MPEDDLGVLESVVERAVWLLDELVGDGGRPLTFQLPGPAEPARPPGSRPPGSPPGDGEPDPTPGP